MAKLYIMCGLAFSGKTTLSKKISEDLDCERIAFDSLWVSTEKQQPIPEGVEGWKFIRNLAKEKTLDFLKSGISVVYDENNPKKEHREEFESVAKKAGAESFVVYLDTPLDIIRKREEENRISQNRHEVNPTDFDKVLNDFEKPTSEENVLVFKPEDDIDNFIEKLKAVA